MTKALKTMTKASYITRQYLIKEKRSAYINEMCTTGGNRISEGN